MESDAHVRNFVKDSGRFNSIRLDVGREDKNKRCESSNSCHKKGMVVRSKKNSRAVNSNQIVP